MPHPRRTKKYARSNRITGTASGRVKTYSRRQTDRMLQLTRAGKVHTPLQSTKRNNTKTKNPIVFFSMKKSVVFVFVVILLVVGGIGIMQYRQHVSGQVLGAAEDITSSVPEYYRDAISVQQNDFLLTITPLAGRRVPAEFSEHGFLYTDAYQSTNVVYEVLADSIEQKIVLKEPGHPTSFSYSIGNERPYVIEKDTDGNIVLYQRPDGLVTDLSETQRIFTIPVLFVEDALKNRSFSAVTTAVQDRVLTFTIDSAWLEQVKYPITVHFAIDSNSAVTH